MILAAVCIAAFWSPSPAKQAQTGEKMLGRRYINALRGFSLRPPTSTTRETRHSPGWSVTWSRRDAKTGAIDMSLTLFKKNESKKKIDLKPYSKALTKKLHDDRQFYAEGDSTRVIQVAGRGAIDLRGRPGGTDGLWQRQVWIWVRPGQFLVAVISGPTKDKARLDATCQAVLNTLELTDPAKAIDIRKENLKRGELLLESLSDKKLSAVFAAQELWFLLSMKGKEVGYTMLATSPKRMDRANGYEVRSVVRLSLSRQKRRIMKRTLFATADRNVERWREGLTIGLGLKAVRTVEEGVKQKDLIVCQLISGHQERSRQKRLKLPTMGIYLPRVFGMVLPKLVDLKSKKTAYSFATYNSGTNDFDLRTFTVVGPAKITIAGREVQAVLATDQAADDSEAVKVWLDTKGNLLRMETPDGLSMEKAAKSAVLRRFPAAGKFAPPRK